MTLKTARFLPLALIPFLLPLAAGAETRLHPTSRAIQLEPGNLAPPVMRVNGDGSFSLANATSSMARVEFKLRRGQGIHCASAGDPPLKGRRFVVDEGATLVCQADPGRYDFTVYRAGAPAKDAPTGRIEVER